MTRVVVGGFGSRDRCDDGIGPLVAEQILDHASDVELIGPLSEPLDLLGLWDDADLVVVIDAVRSGAPVGTVHVVDVMIDPDGSSGAAHSLEPGVASTHGIGLVGTLRLARAVGRAPRRLVLVGVEGRVFDLGDRLSPAVRECLPEAVRRVRGLIDEVVACA